MTVSHEGSMVERVARAIALELGDNLDHAFDSKSEWNAARGEKGGRFRDINEPFRSDYIDAARAAIEAMRELVPVVRDHEGFPAHQLIGAPEDIWRTFIDAALTPPLPVLQSADGERTGSNA